MYSCVECDEVITNPIGEEKLVLAFKTWLAEINPELKDQFSNEYVVRTNFIYGDLHTHCALSGDKMDICPYCTTKQFIEWLHNKEVSTTVLQRALDFFLSRHDELFVMRDVEKIL